jgi:hypothetical protein
MGVTAHVLILARASRSVPSGQLFHEEVGECETRLMAPTGRVLDFCIGSVNCDAASLPVRRQQSPTNGILPIPDAVRHSTAGQ